MAHWPSRFIRDGGLIARMASVMFLLGALLVALVVALMYLFPAFALFFAVAGVGVAFYQWWSSDKLAMRAMRAREVTPEEAPELHGMIDRLCAWPTCPSRGSAWPTWTSPMRSPPDARPTGRSSA